MADRPRKKKRRRRVGVWIMWGLAALIGAGVTFWAGDLLLGAIAGLGSGGVAWGTGVFTGHGDDATGLDDAVHTDAASHGHDHGLGTDGDGGDFI